MGQPCADHVVGRRQFRRDEDGTRRGATHETGINQQADLIDHSLTQEDAVERPSAVHADQSYAVARVEFLQRRPEIDVVPPVRMYSTPSPSRDARYSSGVVAETNAMASH